MAQGSKAKMIEVEATPSNYTPTGSGTQVEDHLSGIDGGLAVAAALNVRKDGADVGAQPNLNLEDVGDIAVNVSEVGANSEIKVTVDADLLMPRDGGRPFTGDADINGQKLLNVAEAQGVNTLPARKSTAGTLAKGSAVYPVGFDVGNNWFLLEAADADVVANTPAVAIVDSDVTDTVTGFVRISGELLNIDTSAWSIGDELFLSATAGELTNIQPVGFSVAIQPIAEVLSSDITTGIILVTGPWHKERLPQMSAASRVWVSDGSGTPTETDPAGAFAPAAHASDHEIGGSDLISHQSITGSGTNTHAQIDTHIADVANPHSVTAAQAAALALAGGALTGAVTTTSTFDGRDISVDGGVLDAHVADLANPHVTDIGNLGSGTLAELNTAVTDATLIADTRNLTAGAGLTGGGDLSADQTFDAVANADASIVVNANDIQVGVLATDAQHGVRGGGTQHAAATISVAGFLSAADKVLVDVLTTGGVATDYLDATGNYSAPIGTLVDYEPSLGLSTTTSTTFVNKLTFTTVSLDAGDYDIVVTYLWGMTNSNNSFALRTTVGAAIIGVEIITEPADSATTETYPASLSYRETLGAGTHDIEVDFRVTGAGTGRLQRVEVRVYTA